MPMFWTEVGFFPRILPSTTDIKNMYTLYTTVVVLGKYCRGVIAINQLIFKKYTLNIL